MTGKKAINIFFGVAILLATLYPSAHAIHHLASHLSEQHCDHQYASGKNEINHSHHTDDCSTCDFVISKALSSELYFSTYESRSENHPLSYGSKPQQFHSSDGVVNSLRGPPHVG